MSAAVVQHDLSELTYVTVDVPRSRLVKYPLLLKTIQKHVSEIPACSSRCHCRIVLYVTDCALCLIILVCCRNRNVFYFYFDSTNKAGLNVRSYVRPLKFFFQIWMKFGAYTKFHSMIDAYDMIQDQGHETVMRPWVLKILWFSKSFKIDLLHHLQRQLQMTADS